MVGGPGSNASNGPAASTEESPRISVSDEGNLEWERRMHEWDDDDDDDDEDGDDDDDIDGSESGISAESPSVEVAIEVKQEMEAE